MSDHELAPDPHAFKLTPIFDQLMAEWTAAPDDEDEAQDSPDEGGGQG